MAGQDWDRLGQVALALAFVAVVATFRGYGISWDEPLHLEYGRRALEWYLTLGRDRGVFEYQNLYLYGALYDTAATAAAELLPLGPYASRRLLGGLVGLAGALAVLKAGRELAGPRAGTLATLLLLLTPLWMGHAFANPKDVPFATAGAWCLLYQLRILRSLPRPARRDLVGLGLALGCALGIRVGGVILLAPLAFGGLAWLAQAARTEEFGRTLAHGVGAALRVVPALLLAWAVMVAAWPWAQLDPLRNPMRALTEFSSFPLDFTFRFAGLELRTTDLPWWYVPAGFGVKLPLLVVAALGGAMGLALAGSARGSVRADRVGLAAAVLVPPAVVMLTDAVLYDGIRHLLFLLPALAVAAALALDRGLSLLPARHAWAGPLLLAGWAAAMLVDMARLHPYEAVWHNALAGGVRGAEGRFELDYWGTALSEAARTLAREVVRAEGAEAVTRPYRVRVCGPHESALYYLPPRWRAPPDGQGPADFYVSFTRHPCPDAPVGVQVVRVERMGATLAYVLDLRANPLPVVAQP